MRIRARSFLVIAVASTVAACANILGIDDGIPRDEDDASLDASGSDVGQKDASDAALDAPVEAPFSALHCGTLECNFAEGQRCCRTGASSYSCVVDASACVGTYIPCDRPEQCPATDAGAMQCCTTDILTDAGTYVATSIACMLDTKCTPIPTHYVLCGDDSGADCPDGQSCGSSVATLPTFLICK